MMSTINCFVLLFLGLYFEYNIIKWIQLGDANKAVHVGRLHFFLSMCYSIFQLNITAGINVSHFCVCITG